MYTEDEIEGVAAKAIPPGNGGIKNQAGLLWRLRIDQQMQTELTEIRARLAALENR